MHWLSLYMSIIAWCPTAQCRTSGFLSCWVTIMSVLHPYNHIFPHRPWPSSRLCHCTHNPKLQREDLWACRIVSGDRISASEESYSRPGCGALISGNVYICFVVIKQWFHFSWRRQNIILTLRMGTQCPKTVYMIKRHVFLPLHWFTKWPLSFPSSTSISVCCI